MSNGRSQSKGDQLHYDVDRYTGFQPEVHNRFMVLTIMINMSNNGNISLNLYTWNVTGVMTSDIVVGWLYWGLTPF